MKILFVDDNELNRMVTEDMYEIIFPQGKIDTAASAMEALAIENILEYDLILSDIDMPVMDGFAFYTKLREIGYEKPIIALTALAISGDKERMMLHGFDDYISKPIEFELLEKCLQKYLSH